jgi:hypothetical protein
VRSGYGRVSTRDQNPEAQHDALQAAGCDEIFIDTASGKLGTRPELDKALLCAGRAGLLVSVERRRPVVDGKGRPAIKLPASLCASKGVREVPDEFRRPWLPAPSVCKFRGMERRRRAPSPRHPQVAERPLSRNARAGRTDSARAKGRPT